MKNIGKPTRRTTNKRLLPRAAPTRTSTRTSLNKVFDNISISQRKLAIEHTYLIRIVKPRKFIFIDAYDSSRVYIFFHHIFAAFARIRSFDSVVPRKANAHIANSKIFQRSFASAETAFPSSTNWTRSNNNRLEIASSLLVREYEMAPIFKQRFLRGSRSENVVKICYARHDRTHIMGR